MKAIIFLASRSRYHIPRVGGFVHAPAFAAATHPNQPIVFEGRALDMDEFNVAAARWLDRRNPNLGYDVSVRMVEDTAVEEPAPPPPAPEPPPEPAPVVEESNVTPPDFQPFTREGNDIYYQGSRVAMISESGLRCAKGFSELREQIEAWINNQHEPMP